MQYDKELIAHKLDRWDRFITDYHLPEWDAIPDLGLYMDQVVVLLAQYLNFIPAMPGGKESFVTSSTINNYVRLKIMPAPVKRKYFRVHIAYLIMILTMKQSISISDVQKIIPADIPEEDVRAIYQEYSEKFRHIALFFNQQGPGRGGGYPHAGPARRGRRVPAGHRKHPDRGVLQDPGGEAHPPVRGRHPGGSGRRAAPPDVRLLHFTARRIPCPSGRGIFVLRSHSLRQGTRALPYSILSINVP